MTKRKQINVLVGDIKRHMLRLAIPSMGGMFAIIVFNLTDTYFVSRLGTDALAAMGFTFPVIMIIGAFAGGISLGAGSVLARAMGAGNTHKMHRIATDGILLSVLFVLMVSTLGLVFIEPIFKAFGAEGESLELVMEYMTIWFTGAFVVIVPPVSDASMRAMGDMVRPLLVMLTCAIGNVILDPILIFGLFGFPAMGIAGAALATVLSRAIGMVLTLSFVHFHYRLIDLNYNSVKELVASWKEILMIGIPNVLVRLLPQVLRGTMIKMAASTVGIAAVAAIAAGQRIESFATIVSMAISTALVPIIGQNYGRGHKDRVMETRKVVIRIAVIYGLLLFVAILPLGRLLASIFSEDQEVITLTAAYLRIILLGSIGLNQYNWLSECFNAVGKPRYSLVLNTVGTLMILLPAILIGVYSFGFVGMIVGLSFGQFIVGGLAIWMSGKWLV